MLWRPGPYIVYIGGILLFITEMDKKQQERAKDVSELNRLTMKLYKAHYVTCGNCGVIHNENQNETLEKKYEHADDYKSLYYVCNYCKAELDPSNCPDLFY